MRGAEATGSATQSRDLRTGTPVWLDRGLPRVASRQLTESLDVEVVVVGGGISGALVADALVQAGLSVVVLDRRGPVRGSTAASTALLQFELDQPLTLLIRKVGRERAVRAYWRSAAAVGYLRHRVEDLGIRCGFKERETVYLPGNVLDTSGTQGRGAGAGRGRAPLPLHRSRRAADAHRHRAPGRHPFGWCGGGKPGATRGGTVAVGDRSRLPRARPGRGARDREHPRRA